MARDGVLSPTQTERAFERERARVERNGQCFSLAVFQLEAAPTAATMRNRMSQSAQLLRQRIRTYDDVGVVADDSLAVLLPETNGQDTWVFVDGALEELRANELTANCEVYTYPHPDEGEGFDAGQAQPDSEGPKVAREDSSPSHAAGGGRQASESDSAPSFPTAGDAVERDEHSAAPAMSMRSGRAHGSERWVETLSSTAVMERPSRLRMVARDTAGAIEGPSQSVAETPAFAGSSALASLPVASAASRTGWVPAKQRGVESVSAPVQSTETRPIRDLAPFFEESLPRHRRVVDIAVAGSALAVLSPVLITGAALVKLTSPGPIIFAQTRAGRGGRPFQFYKLRSMYKDAEDRKNALRLVNEKDGPIFKIKNDPRITPVGKVLRKFSIDELPQLFNVLKGDMTLVGPRPPVMDEVKEYEPWQRQRLDITGGITCIWQVSGRSEVTFREWMRMDVRYRKQRSLKLDLKLVMKTFGAVFSGKGAY